MRSIFNSKFKLIGLATAFVLLFGLAYTAGTISASRNSAFAQATTPGQSDAPAQSAATVDPQPGNDNSGQAETADGPEASGSEPASSTGPEVDNQAALQAQAKVTPDQAKQAALAKVPGTVVAVNLDDENGTAVYTVTVTPTTGGANQDVKVAASDGSVLKVETGEQENDGEN